MTSRLRNFISNPIFKTTELRTMDIWETGGGDCYQRGGETLDFPGGQHSGDATVGPAHHTAHPAPALRAKFGGNLGPHELGKETHLEKDLSNSELKSNQTLTFQNLNNQKKSAYVHTRLFDTFCCWRCSILCFTVSECRLRCLSLTWSSF